MQQGARGTEAFLDLSIMTLHVSAEGGMTLLAAVLGHPEHLEFLMNTVALQALEQELPQLAARVSRALCDACDLIEHVPRGWRLVRRRCLRNE